MMIRIGMIGSESTHAEAFSSIVNREDAITGQYRYPDMRVTAIYGETKASAFEVSEKCGIPVVVTEFEEMLEQVDAVMIVLRDGTLHLPAALPFLKVGIPVWVDKPFTVSKKECHLLLEAAKEYRTLITGGSTCKYMDSILSAKQLVKNPLGLGRIQGAVLNYPADTESEYGGFPFYAPHLCEMCLQIFGYHPVSVAASENNGSVTAIVKYAEYNVVLNFLKGAGENLLLINGSDSFFMQKLDSAVPPYENGFGKFAEMLRTKKAPLSHDKLFAAVSLMDAVMVSYREKKEIPVEPFGIER